MLSGFRLTIICALISLLNCQLVNQHFSIPKQSKTSLLVPSSFKNDQHIEPITQISTIALNKSQKTVVPLQKIQQNNNTQGKKSQIQPFDKEIGQFKSQQNNLLNFTQVSKFEKNTNQFDPLNSTLLTMQKNQTFVNQKSIIKDSTNTSEIKNKNLNKKQEKLSKQAQTSIAAKPIIIKQQTVNKFPLKNQIDNNSLTQLDKKFLNQQNSKSILQSLKDKFVKLFHGDFDDILFVVSFFSLICLTIIGMYFVSKLICRKYPKQSCFQETSFRCPQYQESPQTSNEYR